MQPFTPQFQGTDWPAEGARVLHVYLVPDLNLNPELAQLVAQCHRAMADHPITLMTTYLHSTVEMIADTTSDAITPAERQALIDALHRHLAGTAPIRATAGSPATNSAGSYLDLHPDHPFDDLRRRVRAAITETRGPEALRHRGGRPHITLGYAHDTADSDTLQNTLRRISPSHVPVAFTEVRLVDALWHRRPRPDGRTAWELTWEDIAAIPLTAADA
ncbi:2'-5' RNA ligase family protein [Kitasatospora sp. NPDC004531]